MLSSVQVKVEHCIGILKGRFQSLKGMWQRIAGKKSSQEVVKGSDFGRVEVWKFEKEKDVFPMRDSWAIYTVWLVA
jgi:hypothetical protein